MLTTQHNTPLFLFLFMMVLQSEGANRVKSYDAYVAASELCKPEVL